MHLRHSGQCYRRLIQARKVYPQALPGIGNRREDKDGPMPIPVLPSAGPREEAFLQDAPQEVPDYDEVFLGAVLDCFLEMERGTTMEEGLERIRHCAMGSTSSFGKMKKTMIYISEELEKEDAHLDWQIAPELVELIAKMAARRFRLPWFFSVDKIKAPIDDEEIRDAAWNYCATAKGPWKWSNQS